MLIKSLLDNAELGAVVRDAYAAICVAAEDAVSNSLNGTPGQAARALLDLADSTLNARLMDLAIHTMERYEDRIEGVRALRVSAEILRGHYCSYGTQVTTQGDARAFGGLALP